MGFAGFPEDLLTFYEGLEADNSKPYWTDHRAMYDTCVAAPMRALLDELGPEFGEAKFFRPYRDIRFSRDKTPYKTHAAAVVSGSTDGGTAEGALYFQVSADGLLVAGGYYRTSTDQAQRLREAVADDRTGAQLGGILARLTEQGWRVGGERLQRVPKPWTADHPRADLLRAKSLSASRHYPPEPWLHTPTVRDRIADDWRRLAPLNRWLRDHVGASRTRSVR
jgi:uncharacterized protein (TIGR02453 family)